MIGPKQAGPFRVEATIPSPWWVADCVEHTPALERWIEYVPTREQAVRRVQVFWSWGAEVVKVTNTARYQ